MFDSIKFDKHFKKVRFQKPIKSTKIKRIEEIKMKQGMLNIFLRKKSFIHHFFRHVFTFSIVFVCLEFSRIQKRKDHSKIQ